MSRRDFQIRWLKRMGVDPAAIPGRLEAAARRTRAYPAPMAAVQGVLTWLVEYLFPLLLLGSPRRASRLGDGAFERLENRAHGSSFIPFRAAFVFARLPLWEVAFPDVSPVSKPHPLKDKPLASAPGRPPATTQADYDVVIVGSGAGGAPLAWELARAGRRVALLEQGGIVEARSTGDALREYYLKQAMAISASGGIVPVLSGVGLGGTTPINSGTSLAPREEYLREWRVEGFHPRELSTYVARVLQLLPVVVPPRELLDESGILFEDGLRALGRTRSYVLPRNAPDCEGMGRCPFGCPVHAKRSTDISFLPDAIDHGCEVHSGAVVDHIRESSAGATVFAHWRGGVERRFRARHVVLAAGALGTPRLIRANRLGARWSQAGDGLKIHVATKLFALMPKPLKDGGVPQGVGYMPPELPRIVMEGVRTPSSAVAPLLPVAGEAFRSWMRDYPRVATFGMMLTERSRGSVRWFGEWPVIRHPLSEDDVRDLARGVLLAAEVYLAAGAEKVLLPLFGMKNEVRSVPEIREIDPHRIQAQQLGCSGFHPQGTAGMGRVVDAGLGLIGSSRIHVCDASVLPDSPGVNPQVTIMALALRLAEKLS